MADAVDVVETKRNVADIEDELNQWIADNGDATIEHVDVERRGRNRLLHYIWYTAAE